MNPLQVCCAQCVSWRNGEEEKEFKTLYLNSTLWLAMREREKGG